ncbi:MAG: phosphoribosyltransferase [Patescibacteria group bacterium]|jgi:hypoxanthine phosphoribosyltransferase
MKLNNICFGDSLNFITPTLNDLNELAFTVSQKILEDGRKFDRIVTLAKGGWPFTRSLVDFLGIKEVASMGVKFYGGINKRLEKPEIYQDLPVSVSGERILLFDDVADTGGSLSFAKDYLNSLGIEDIATATLFYKPHSVIKPDYYAEETDAWIIFPYEFRETMIMLGKKWCEAGVSKEECEKRFITLGFKKEWLKYFDFLGNTID